MVRSIEGIGCGCCAGVRCRFSGSTTVVMYAKNKDSSLFHRNKYQNLCKASNLSFYASCWRAKLRACVTKLIDGNRAPSKRFCWPIPTDWSWPANWFRIEMCAPRNAAPFVGIVNWRSTIGGWTPTVGESIFVCLFLLGLPKCFRKGRNCQVIASIWKITTSSEVLKSIKNST